MFKKLKFKIRRFITQRLMPPVCGGCGCYVDDRLATEVKFYSDCEPDYVRKYCLVCKPPFDISSHYYDEGKSYYHKRSIVQVWMNPDGTEKESKRRKRV